MTYRQVGALIVADDGRVAGIVTERDCSRKMILTDRSSRNTPVREIMSTTVRCVGPDQTTDECMALMTEYRIRYLPVVAAVQVIGMVSIGDLVKHLISEQEHTIRQLEHYIHGNSLDSTYGGSKAKPVGVQRTESVTARRVVARL
jgi:IMP dehydrogenase